MTLRDIQCCIIIPTYNNEKTLNQVIDAVLKFWDDQDIIVINDGSTDDTLLTLARYGLKLRVLTNNSNRGKGYSLRKAFKEAIRLGYENAITLDSDGQHLPDYIPLFIETAFRNAGALLIGSDSTEWQGSLSKSSFANKLSNFWFRLETGISLPDNPTGFRLYPLEPLRKIRLFTTKFETETELLVKLAWNDVPIVPVDIHVARDKGWVINLKNIITCVRSGILNAWLAIPTIFYFLPKRLITGSRERLIWKVRQNAVERHESDFRKASTVDSHF